MKEQLAASSSTAQNVDPATARDLDRRTVEKDVALLATTAAFGPPGVVLAAHRLAWELARHFGIYPASIDAIYREIGQGTIKRRFTVPAVNMRALAYHSARGVFQAMREADAGAVIFELSRGEIGFTGQRPHEYATMVLCAAIAEGYSGPVFLQGDHFQLSASRYAKNPERELRAVESLIREAVSAGFYNIDIDASTLVDLSCDDIDQQQESNIRLTSRLARLVRELEPEEVTVSLGGEIGEVGEHNTTVEEVRTFLGGMARELPNDTAGLTKLSVQTGTRHGGNVLADGSFGDMPVDFGLIRELSQICRTEFGLAGCVQHGASMLSREKIGGLPDANCTEVHLAAAFLNTVYDCLPDELVQAADDWARDNHAEEWKPEWSQAQFLHHARRYPIGPFKAEWWRREETHQAIRETVAARAADYILALGAAKTADLVVEKVGHGPVAWHGDVAPPVFGGDEDRIGDLQD